MVHDKNPKNSRESAKDLLLEDYRYFAESFWKNEQTGETRANWFIGLVTAAAGGLIVLASAEHGPKGETLRMIVVVSLFALLVLGIVTLFRVLTRNENTDGYKRGCDAVRQIFRDQFDSDQILLQYYPLGHRGSGGRRKFGGLAHTVAALNCLLFAAVVGSFVYLPRTPGAVASEFTEGLDWTYVVTAITFCVAGILQFFYIAHRDKVSKRKLQSDEPTHAGGIVFRLKEGTVQYLLVGPKKEVVDEWLLPKGHIEKNEGDGEAALREVREETGVLGRMICLVGTSEFKTKTESVTSKYYLIEALHQSKPTEARRMNWFEYKDALQRVTHDQNKLLLQQAERRRTEERP